MCSRALLMLKKKSTLDKDQRKKQKRKIQHDLSRILPEDEEREDAFGDDFDDIANGITLDKVVRGLIGLANKGLIRTQDFSPAHAYLANFNIIEKDFYQFVRKKFADSIYQNE
jgi:hypothetical protein